jgi:carbonic anhydrase/acetyltransferase-like protein (isoleucine patch superfamily)
MSDALDVRFQPSLVDPQAWVAPNATLTARVHVAAQAGIWFGAVLRGDVEPIFIGEGTNIQDLSCLHADPGFPCSLGKRVTVGHRAIVHGATIADEVLIGMGAIILTGATIGKHSIIGAGALVTEGRSIPPRSLVVGVPAKVVREVTQEEVQKLLQSAQRYIAAAALYRQQWTGASKS